MMMPPRIQFISASLCTARHRIATPRFALLRNSTQRSANPRNMTTLADICAEFLIEIVPPRQQRQRGPGQTCAEGTLRQILRDEGAAHLRSVVMTIMESENNRMALVRPVLLAVSDILRAHPTWLGDEWFKRFDRIDLCGLYAVAKRHREMSTVRHVVAGLILERLRPHFDEDEQGRLI